MVLSIPNIPADSTWRTIYLDPPIGLQNRLEYALFLTNNSISIFSIMAIIMLVGIVVNNGILLIDYITVLRKEKGLGLKQAILDASPTRLRPIIMTNLATILGMTPLALGLGSGGEFRSSMAIAAIGGLISSTIFTLFLIPGMYHSVEGLKEKLKNKIQEA